MKRPREESRKTLAVLDQAETGIDQLMGSGQLNQVDMVMNQHDMKVDKPAESLSTSAHFLSTPEIAYADTPLGSSGKALLRLATVLPSKQSVDGSNPSGDVEQSESKNHAFRFIRSGFTGPPIRQVPKLTRLDK